MDTVAHHNQSEDFDRFRYRQRVQIVALVGTIPFIKLAFGVNNKHLLEQYNQDREVLVFLWSLLLCVYVLQLIMGIWLLAATREVYSEYTIGNCQVWCYVAVFSFCFYIGEMAYDINHILYGPESYRALKHVLLTMMGHALKIIYRVATLVIVNNFLYDICRPVYRYLSQGSYQYKYYYHTTLGIPLPSRRMSFAVPNLNHNSSSSSQNQSQNQCPPSQFPVQVAPPPVSYNTSYPQPPRPPQETNLESKSHMNARRHVNFQDDRDGGGQGPIILPLPPRRPPRVHQYHHPDYHNPQAYHRNNPHHQPGAYNNPPSYSTYPQVRRYHHNPQIPHLQTHHHHQTQQQPAYSYCNSVPRPSPHRDYHHHHQGYQQTHHHHNDYGYREDQFPVSTQ